MEFRKIRDANAREFQEAWKLYESSFHLDQRRSLTQQYNVFGSKGHEFYVFYENNFFVGFIELWNLNDFIFIHYLAVAHEKRGEGYGSQVLTHFISKSQIPIILEVELPISKLQKNRIMFYEKLGFQLNKYDYVQPAYSKYQNPVSLLLMSYPGTLTKADFLSVKKKLYSIVYEVKI